jgi:hypothetical protein
VSTRTSSSSYVQFGFEEALREAFKQGFKEGFKEGFKQGAVASAGEKLLRLLDGRGLKPTDAQRAQVAGTEDMPQLDRWFDRAINAESAADVFRD